MSLASELGATFLFESLSPEQLDGLAALGSEVRFDAGQTIFVQGYAAEYLWVLLAGEMQLERIVSGQSVGLNTSSRPGTYAGGVQALGWLALGSVTMSTTTGLPLPKACRRAEPISDGLSMRMPSQPKSRAMSAKLYSPNLHVRSASPRPASLRYGLGSERRSAP